MDVSSLQPGNIFANDFEVIRLLGKGGMGAVYAVTQRSTGRRRALKVMLPELASDAQSRRRFEQEARIGALIDSEHVVDVVTAGVDSGTGAPFLVMEMLQGETLESYLHRKQRLPPAELIDIYEQLCGALSRAHRHPQKIVHRDLKPENIFLVSSPRKENASLTHRVKILDFGIARIVAEAKTPASQTKGPLGTPLFMAPEQFDPKKGVDPATDVWALGLIAFYLLTGKSYWLSATSGTIQALYAEIINQPLSSATNRAKELGVHGALPSWFDAWFSQCVNRDVAHRFPDAEAAFQPLARVVLSTPPIPPSPSISIPPANRLPMIILVSSIAAPTLLVAGFFLLKPTPTPPYKDDPEPNDTTASTALTAESPHSTNPTTSPSTSDSPPPITFTVTLPPSVTATVTATPPSTVNNKGVIWDARLIRNSVTKKSQAFDDTYLAQGACLKRERRLPKTHEFQQAVDNKELFLNSLPASAGLWTYEGMPVQIVDRKVTSYYGTLPPYAICVKDPPR